MTSSRKTACAATGPGTSTSLPEEKGYTATRLGACSADEVVSAVEVLAHGQIDLSGLVTSTPSGPGIFQLAVTGGTGNYRDARGYATVVPGSTPTVTIHLTP